MTDEGRTEPDGERTEQDREGSGGLVSMFRGADTFIAAFSPTIRGAAAVSGFAIIMFTTGVAAGSYGVRGDIAELRQADERAAAARTDMRSNIERNESDISALGATITQADIKAFREDFAELRESIRTIDRVICIEVEKQPTSVCSAR